MNRTEYSITSWIALARVTARSPTGIRVALNDHHTDGFPDHNPVRSRCPSVIDGRPGEDDPPAAIPRQSHGLAVQHDNFSC